MAHTPVRAVTQPNPSAIGPIPEAAGHGQPTMFRDERPAPSQRRCTTLRLHKRNFHTPPLTECLKISADGLPGLQSHLLRAKTAIWELSIRGRPRPMVPLKRLASLSLSARALAKRPYITAAGPVSSVSRSLQAIRNPVSDALKGYLAL
jgi:hypothetical protein